MAEKKNFRNFVAMKQKQPSQKLKNKTAFIVDWFKTNQPNVSSELNFSNTFELLVAVMLSAQCTDKRVNMVTPNLFQHFPSSKSLSEATFDEVLQLISSISYPNSKARHLIAMAQMVENDFNGEVPTSPDDLEKLSGVGRKTANVVSAVAYGLPRMAVDTHIFRVCNRLGLTKATNPLQSERQMMVLLKEEDVATAHHWFLLHGRYVCVARKPKCASCPFTEVCDYHQTSEK